MQLGHIGPFLKIDYPRAIFDSNASAGMAVYVSGNAHVDLADKRSDLPARAVGLAAAATLSGETAEYVASGELELDDWTAVIGSALLTPNAAYFLGDDGQLQTACPTTNGEFVVIMGIALTATKLKVAIHHALTLES